MAVGGLRHAPAALPQGKTRYSLYRRLDGPVLTDAKNLAPIGVRYPDRPALSKSLYPIPAPNDDYIFKQHLLLFSFLYRAIVLDIQIIKPTNCTNVLF